MHKVQVQVQVQAHCTTSILRFLHNALDVSDCCLLMLFMSSNSNVQLFESIELFFRSVFEILINRCRLHGALIRSR